MFEPDLYRKACSESLRLPEEKLQEMIFMTENKKRALRKPLQVALIVAALVCALCVTAAAANPEAVKELWKNITMSITVLQDDEDRIIIETNFPEITVEDVDGRTILTINDESADITDALAENGKYVGEWSNESSAGQITVYPDKRCELKGTVDMDLSDGSQLIEFITRSGEGWADLERDPYETWEDGTEFYQFTDGDKAGDAIYLPPEE